MTFLTKETGGSSQQFSPTQLYARESTPKEPGLKNFEKNRETLWFLYLAKQSTEQGPQYESSNL